MASEGASPPKPVGAAPSGSALGASPVAVVWCRQVDNEAESPGYTTVPEEFPGQRETLEVIRSVGHLTVNVADTHDYWDPDPSQPLSYYPNLFLYPAYSGRYTCVGRMFLSTEDRPRLGMKTLVLDTAQLFASGEFGATVLRWHASMGGPRREGSRPPPAADPNLFQLLGEGFLFHRGSTDPVVVVASDEWEVTMQTILELVRLLPASLVALGAILAFPYFLPQPKTNLHEFTEQLPLSLALMRVPRGEAAGDRHEKRMSSWESAPVTLRDLTQGVPTPKGKENVPLVLQYVRDHLDAKLLPISQRVDLVEMARVKGHLADPERQTGRDRRKEMWRIGTAMESAALLLQRARGRHVPVNVETAKRAQEYLQARLPEVDPAQPAAAPEPAVVEPLADTSVAASLPPWLRVAPPPAPEPPTPSGAPEVVPVSISEDPSLLSPAARASAQPPAKPSPPPAAPLSFPPPAAPAPGAPPVGAVAPESVRGASPPTVDVAALRSQLQQDLFRLLEDRIATLPARLNTAPATRIDDQLRADLDARTQSQIAAAVEAATAQLREALRQSEERASERLDSKLSASQESVQTATRTTAIEEVDRRVQSVLIPRLGDADRRSTEQIEHATALQREALRSDLERAVEALKGKLQNSEEDLRNGLSSQLELHLREVEERELQLRKEIDRLVETSVAGRTGELDARRARDAKELEQRLALLIDGRSRESADRLQVLSQQLLAAEARQTAALEKARRDSEAAAGTLVGSRLAEVEARRASELKELEQRLGQLVEGRSRDVHDKAQGANQLQEARLSSLVDQRVASGEDRVRQTLESRLHEIEEERAQGLADLQVRLQSFFEQKILEGQERERQKYVELLARLKSEVDSTMARAVDSARFDSALREKIGRSLETVRTDLQRALESRIATAEDRLKVDQAEVAEHLTRIEAALEERRAEVQALDDSIKSEIDDVDRRTQILSDRLVPIVRKTWLRVAELQQSNGPSADAEAQVNQLRRDLTRELHRVDAELLERTTEIRDRMETAISSQGRVWLTLIRQLSQLTGDRRAPSVGRAEEDDTDSLSALTSSLFPDASGAGATDPVNPLDPDPDEPLTARKDPEPAARSDPAARRRFRRNSR